MSDNQIPKRIFTEHLSNCHGNFWTHYVKGLTPYILESTHLAEINRLQEEIKSLRGERDRWFNKATSRSKTITKARNFLVEATPQIYLASHGNPELVEKIKKFTDDMWNE